MSKPAREPLKHPPTLDLSRFGNCKTKKPAICDLLMLPEFKAAVDSYDGEITDQWILNTSTEVLEQIKKQAASDRIDGTYLNRPATFVNTYAICKNAVRTVRRTLEE